MIKSLLIDLSTLLALPFLMAGAWIRKWRHRGPNHILIIQLGKIGDMVCTTPLFRALSTHDPCASITVLCLEQAVEVLKGNLCIDETIAVDAPEYRGILGRLRLLWALKFGGYTISVSVLPGTFNAVLGLWSCAPTRIHTRGGRMGVLGLFFHFLHTHPIAYRRHTRTYVHYMRIAELIGAQPVQYRHEIYLSSAERYAAEVWLRQRGIGSDTPFAILALSAGNRLKEWPLERFVAVASYLLDERKMHVVFSSRDETITKRATMMIPSIRSLDAGGLPLRQLAALIERATLFVSVDTGPLYIAHALGVPVVDIVGPVDPEEQPPPPGPRVALVLPQRTRPSSFVAETLRSQSAEQQQAIKETSVDQVIRAISQLLR